MLKVQDHVDEKTIEATFEEAKKQINSKEGWIEITPLPEGCTGSWYKNTPGSGVYLVKSVAIIEGITPEELGDKIWSETPEYKKQQDDAILEYKILGESEDVKINYQLYKAPWPLWNRDLLAFAAVKRDEEGRYQVGKSLKDQTVVPEVNTVRAELVHSAYVFRALEGDENKTELTYLAQLDPKGSIPSSVVNANLSRGAKKVVQIKESVEQGKTK